MMMGEWFRKRGGRVRFVGRGVEEVRPKGYCVLLVVVEVLHTRAVQVDEIALNVWTEFFSFAAM